MMPTSISASSETRSRRSTVHHQAAKGVRSIRETMKLPPERACDFCAFHCVGSSRVRELGALPLPAGERGWGEGASVYRETLTPLTPLLSQWAREQTERAAPAMSNCHKCGPVPASRARRWLKEP